jgi:hypothetical protein
VEPNGWLAALGLFVNTFAVLAIAWRGGRILGSLETTMGSLSNEVRDLRTTRDDHMGILSRVVGQLDDLERRVGHLEGNVRRAPR